MTQDSSWQSSQIQKSSWRLNSVVLERKVKRYIPHVPIPASTFPLHPTQERHLLQLMNLHWCSSVIQSWQFPVGLLDIAQSMVLGECTMAWICCSFTSSVKYHSIAWICQSSPIYSENKIIFASKLWQLQIKMAYTQMHRLLYRPNLLTSEKFQEM